MIRCENNLFVLETKRTGYAFILQPGATDSVSHCTHLQYLSFLNILT